MKALVVDDDVDLLDLVTYALRREGFEVVPAVDGQQALQRWEGENPDIVLLDGNLPKLDGFEVCRRIRHDSQTPVIMLTARDALRDTVRNLDTGADDYLTKPFHIEELLSRLRALLRRIEGDELLRIGDLEVNTDTRQVRRGGRSIDLTTREYDVLEFMARNARRVLPRDLILARVWEQTPDVDTNVVDVYIGYLRRKVDAAGESRLIHTVRGVGFALREEERSC